MQLFLKCSAASLLFLHTCQGLKALTRLKDAPLAAGSKTQGWQALQTLQCNAGQTDNPEKRCAEALAFAHLSSGVGGNCGIFFHIFTGQAPRKPWPLYTFLLAWGEIVGFFSTSSPGRPRGSPGLCTLFFWRRGKLWAFFSHLHRAGPAEALALAHLSSGVGGNCGLFFHIFTGQAPRKPWPLRTCLLA